MCPKQLNYFRFNIHHKGGCRRPTSLRRCGRLHGGCRARKISAVDYDLRDLKAHMLPQLLAFVPSSGELHWKLWEPFANLQNPTQMLPYNWMNNQPLHLANINFHLLVFHPLEVFSGSPSSFVDRRKPLYMLQTIVKMQHRFYSNAIKALHGIYPIVLIGNYFMVFFYSCRPRPSKATWAMKSRPFAQAKRKTWFFTIEFLAIGCL